MTLNPSVASGVTVAPVQSRTGIPQLKWLLFSFQGRITRTQYWKASLCTIGVFYAVLFAIGFASAWSSFQEGTEPNLVALMLLWPLSLPIIWISAALQVKRWHDRDKSATWWLINLIPLVGSLWTLVECGFLRGTQGPNAYGEDPLTRHG